MPRLIPLCASRHLLVGQILAVPNPLLGTDKNTAPEVMLLRQADGSVRAYLNRCQHIGVPLDMGTRRFRDPGSTHLRCLHHGALYRAEDGHCIAGPCRGEKLVALSIEETQGVISLHSEV